MAKYKLQKRLKRYNTYVPSKEYYDERDKLRDEIRIRVSEYHKRNEQTLGGFFQARYGPIIEKILEPKLRLLPDDKELNNI